MGVCGVPQGSTLVPFPLKKMYVFNLHYIFSPIIILFKSFNSGLHNNLNLKNFVKKRFYILPNSDYRANGYDCVNISCISHCNYFILLSFMLLLRIPQYFKIICFENVFDFKGRVFDFPQKASKRTDIFP